MSIAQQNLYEIIGLPRDAGRDLIEEQCVRLGEQYHPDKNVGDIHAALMFAQIEKAYETLVDPTRRAAYDAELSPQWAKSIEIKNTDGKVYPDDVLQSIARELTITHTLCAPRVSNELDPRISFELWCKVEHFVLYVIESAIRVSERLHPSSKSRLTHLLIEEWIACPMRKPFARPSLGIVPRTIVALVVETGLHATSDRKGYVQFRTLCDRILNSPYRKTNLKGYDDLQALTLLFLTRIKDDRTDEGQPIHFGGTGAEIESLFADCFAEAVQTIQNGLFPIPND
jgi:hypothetical protein